MAITSSLDIKVGKLIRRLRMKSHMTQADLAKLMKCTNSAISYYESASRSIDLEQLHRLGNIFKVDLNYFIL